MGDYIGTFPEVYEAMQESRRLGVFNTYIFKNQVNPSSLNPLHICKGLPSYGHLADGLVILLEDVNLDRTLRLFDRDSEWFWTERYYTMGRRSRIPDFPLGVRLDAVSPHPKEMMAGVAQ